MLKMHKWIRLLYKCILVSAPLWLAVIISRLCLLYIVGEGYVGPLWSRNHTASAQDKEYDVLVLGDSVANSAYLPEVLSEKILNLAVAGSSTADGYYTLSNYLDHNPAPKDIFISYMDYHLKDDTIVWDVGNYIHKYSIEQNQEIYDAIDEYASGELSELISDNYWREVYYYKFYTPIKYSHALEYTLIENRPKRNKALYDSITRRNGRYSTITNQEYEIKEDVGYHSFYVSKFNEYYYRKILDLCSEKGIFCHLIKLPLPENSEFTKYYSTDVWDYYIYLLNGYDNVDFRWFHTRYSSEYFMDQYHLNNHGSFRSCRELKNRYTDVFNDSKKYSPDTLLAIDEDIAGENILSELLKWIDGKPYTIVFLDNNVDLGENYYMCLGWSEERDVVQLQIGDKLSETAVYYLSSDGRDFPKDITVEEVGNRGIMVNLSNGESCLLESTSEPGVSFAVIDNVNNTIVCQRESLFSDFKFSKIL